MIFKIFALFIILIGIIYIIKPDIFQRWIWKETAISQRILGPEKNKIYMRVLGIIFVITGAIIFIII
jgi:hypothetical protein